MRQHALRYTVVATFVIVVTWSTSLTVAEQQPASSRSSVRVSLPLMIGGASFRIGMPRQEAMALIAECCKTSAQQPDSMFLVDKNSNSIIGGIFFRDGRVSSLERHDKQSQDKAASDFVLAMYRSVLERNTVVTLAGVTVMAFSEELGNASQRHLLLTFPNGRKLRITQANLDDGGVVANLHEER
jgi:hypothetical protein